MSPRSSLSSALSGARLEADTKPVSHVTSHRRRRFLDEINARQLRQKERVEIIQTLRQQYTLEQYQQASELEGQIRRMKNIWKLKQQAHNAHQKAELEKLKELEQGGANWKVHVARKRVYQGD